MAASRSGNSSALAGISEIQRVLGGIEASIKGVQERLDHADASREKTHTKVNDLVTRTTMLERDFAAMRDTIDGIQDITDQAKTLRDKAAGMGLAGKWLIRIGLAVVSVGGWIIGVLQYLSGRPPH